MKRTIAVTGIPKSGTSYLCALLHQFSNTVMLSEPPLLDLTHKPPERGIKELYEYYYKEVYNKKETPNKWLKEGVLSSDYRTQGWKIVRGVHKFDNKDFIFGIKSPSTFLDRLPFLLDSMPDTRVAVIVRDPFDTVGSFRRFSGGINYSPGAHKLKQYYKENYRLDQDKINELPSGERPAAIWKYWTDIIIKNIDRIIFVRYQDAVLKPQETLDRIFGDWYPGKPLSKIEPSQIRYSRECMHEGDKEAVEKYCLENAEYLKVILDIP